MTWRKIDKEWHWFVDIGCDDFERARQNRKMVANKEKTEGYQLAEQGVEVGYIQEENLDYRLESGDLEGFEIIETINEPVSFDELIKLMKEEPDG